MSQTISNERISVSAVRKSVADMIVIPPKTTDVQHNNGFVRRARLQAWQVGASLLVLGSVWLGVPSSASALAERADGYIAVLNALQQTAQETLRVCQSTQEPTSCALAQMAMEAWRTGQDSMKDCLAGDGEACALMDQAAALLGYQPGPEPSMPSPRQSGGPSVHSPFGGGGAMSCDDYRVQYETCKAQVRSGYGPYRPGAISQRRAADAQCRAILEAAAAVCQGGGRSGVGGRRDIGSERSPAPAAPERGPIGNPYDSKNYERDIVIGNPYDWKNYKKIK